MGPVTTRTRNTDETTPNSLPELLRQCHTGALPGGLSVALDLRPDELIGALALALGGKAAQIRVLDVREEPEPELWVRLDSQEFHWVLEDGLFSLIASMNQTFASDASVKACVVVGEWEDMLQLWCVEKIRLKSLLPQGWFSVLNREHLNSLFARGTK
jgi:hypothetical protein